MRNDEESLKEEIEDLTQLLRTDSDWADLRQCLANEGHDAESILLAGFVEDEYGHEFGAFVTRDGRAFEYSRSTKKEAQPRFTEWKLLTVDHLAVNYPAVPVALNLRGTP